MLEGNANRVRVIGQNLFQHWHDPVAEGTLKIGKLHNGDGSILLAPYGCASYVDLLVKTDIHGGVAVILSVEQIEHFSSGGDINGAHPGCNRHRAKLLALSGKHVHFGIAGQDEHLFIVKRLGKINWFGRQLPRGLHCPVDIAIGACAWCSRLCSL